MQTADGRCRSRALVGEPRSLRVRARSRSRTATAGLREPGPRHSELSRRRRDLAGRHAGLGAVEAGQHRARRAARRTRTSTSRTRCARSARASISPPATEDAAARIDHDNASLASAVAFDPRGVYMFVALETSREVAVVDAHGQWEIFRFDVGRAPQGLALSPDGSRLFVNNFMDRTVGVFDLAPLLQTGATQRAARSRRCNAVATERLTAHRAEGQAVLLRRARPAPGARPLHELRDLPQRRRAGRPRLGSHRHGRRPAQHDQPERPRRRWRTGSCTGARTSTRCRTSKARSARSPAAPGLMTDAAFNTQTRSQPLGTTEGRRERRSRRARGLRRRRSSTFRSSPYRNADGTLTATRSAGPHGVPERQLRLVPRAARTSRTAARQR